MEPEDVSRATGDGENATDMPTSLQARSGEAVPGFGARITRISAEGRQLVYRYVRNREPMFYDDL